MAKHLLQKDDVVEILNFQPAASQVTGEIRILYQDANYIVADKPAGILSNDDENSVESMLRRQLHSQDIQAVHRLDRDTSGCLLFARNSNAFKDMVETFKKKSVRKTYHVLAAGFIEKEEQDITLRIDDEHALTRLRRLDGNRKASHMSAIIETGRTHQIRKHLDIINHPVLGDRQYGMRFGVAEFADDIPRQMLHSYSMEFKNPSDGNQIFAKAPLPDDFKRCLDKLRLK
jgi:RluA family pseudouridine synthase